MPSLQSSLRVKIAQLRNVSGRTVEEAKLYMEKAAELELQLSEELKIDDKISQGRILTDREKMMHRRANFIYDRAIEHAKATLNTFGLPHFLYFRSSNVEVIRQRYARRSHDSNRDFSEFIGHLCATDAQFKISWNGMSREERKEWRRKNWDENLLGVAK